MSARSKNRLAKPAGAEVTTQSRQEKWHATVAQSAFQINIYMAENGKTSSRTGSVYS